MAWESAAEKARTGDLTAAQARKVLAEIVAASSGESLTTHTVESWFAEWMKNKAAGASANTILRYRQVARDFLQHLGERSRKSLAGVTPNDIVSFRDKLHSEGRAASTCNTVVKKILSVPFEAARKQGYIPTNPVAAVELVKERMHEEGKEPFTRPEIVSLLKHSDGDWHGAILFAVTTGQRLGDVTNLTHDLIDLKNWKATIRTQKTSEKVTVFIHDDFAEWLSKQPKGVGSNPVFPSLAGKKVNGAHGLSLQFRGIMQKAKIKERVIEAGGDKGRTRNSKGFHSFRHTFTSDLANAGVSPEIRQKLTGHRDSKVHARYTHLDLKTLKKATAKLPRLRKS